MPEVDHEQEAIDELRAAFAIFDKEGKGFVEIRECKSLFYTLGIKITKSAIREMIEKDGKDGQNSLDFNEFSGLAMPLFKKRVLVCEEIGESIPDDELNEIIDEASRYRDDGIRMADYVRVVRRKRDDDE
ncbi:Ca2-binding protein [Aureococcus anophagefferens]|nr:Ca2-binding protein [Aureococcus anophagefferens]